MDRTIKELELLANEIRMTLIQVLEHAGSGHSAGPLGLADIFTALYFNTLVHSSKDPFWSGRDYLILSNGHCCPIQYVAMAYADYFPKDELFTLRQFGSRLQGHPERTKLPGLENTSGPLGSGLSQSLGIALGLKLKKLKNHVYCILGDGELNEGNIWEAVMFGAKYNPGNITVIVDRNNIQIDGPTESVMPLEDLAAKWQAFGWHTIEIDGNNIASIIDNLKLAKSIKEKPTVIIAHTIPGFGVDFMEGDYRWHGKTPDSGQELQALRDLRSLKGKLIHD